MAKLDYKKSDGKGISYSRLLTAHACPRKFQLENIYKLGGEDENVDFSFGHAVAAGVQSLVTEPENLNKALVLCFANWNLGIFENKDPKKKSLFYAVIAVQKFHEMMQSNKRIFSDYKVATFEDKNGKEKPAVELTFGIHCHHDYTYEGHIDLVLAHVSEPLYIVLEIKTTAFNNIHDAMYKNSAQALGYSVVLDSIARDLGARNSYQVLYLVYKAGKQEFEWLRFPKNRVQRAEFINSLILDIEVLEIYKETGFYPKRGENCYSFFRPCEYFEDACELSDDALEKLVGSRDTATEEEDHKFREMDNYDFEYDLEEIRESQLEAISETIARG